MRRQTATGGSNSAGSGRALRLDPLSLPVSYSAHDTRADGGIRQIELHRERVVLRRAVSGMRMALNLRVSDFLGIALREIDDTQLMLILLHRDPSLSIPLCVSEDDEEIVAAWAMWSETFALPQLQEPKREAAPRRRRRNAIRSRRPRFLMRRRVGAPLNPVSIHRGEREIIARD
ncbi:hypothetical protein HL667_20550 [Bradyrhizobium sp. 83012]|uniref:Uncharacterized protein n=1 Tax=Bradyrhizobium aeschynomenes TaxID=2734909 RepID=A0ABX2CIA8_9BRAD|nr:DUF6101 family protein [Bradyrhizobium aeschynomenes]NPU11161.1 hypothetical protein [Bradyrhizobium aeschynomenes]NPU67405.1 hypothetical protein [Bradyrhizobium aeschynomenes]NPV21823.1 hypothetical protein [Bradyrhizobium aeschynomenes]